VKGVELFRVPEQKKGARYSIYVYNYIYMYMYVCYNRYIPFITGVSYSYYQVASNGMLRMASWHGHRGRRWAKLKGSSPWGAQLCGAGEKQYCIIISSKLLLLLVVVVIVNYR
jgi:hypothetical protein